MENSGNEKHEESFLKIVMQDVMDDVKFSKETELAFEDYYEKPCIQNMIRIVNCVTNTDFYKLHDNQQHYVAFAVGLICKTLLDNNVNSEQRKKFNAFPNQSFIKSLASKYMGNKDENFKTRIVNIANCKDVDEIISYIRNELVHYIDIPFNIHWLVKNLLDAEKNPINVLKKWILNDFLYEISGKDKDDSNKED